MCTITQPITNVIPVDPPALSFEHPGILHWQGISNLTYSVFVSTNLTSWDLIGTATSTTPAFSFTNLIGTHSQRFYRVTYP